MAVGTEVERDHAPRGGGPCEIAAVHGGVERRRQTYNLARSSGTLPRWGGLRSYSFRSFRADGRVLQRRRGG